MADFSSLPIASSQKRIFSFVIDDVIVSLFFVFVFYGQISTFFSDTPVFDQTALESINIFISQNIFVLFAIKILYQTVLIWQNGMTIGKYVTKTRVIDLETGERPTFLKALLRALLRIASEVFFYLGFLMAFFVPLRQTLHDKLSNCVVVDA